MADVASPPPFVPPGLVREAHPELFDLRAMPAPPKQLKPGQLPQHAIRQFFEEGYVLVPEFFRPEELEPCRQAVERQVEKLAQKLYNAGKIKNLYKEYGLFERLTQIDKEFPGANIILLKYPDLCEEFKQLWTNERLLNVVEQLIGPEISGNPLWNLRPKTPQSEAVTVPWHQDCAYLDNDCYATMQATAWIPLLDTNASNGCMQMVRRGHRKGRIATHQCCDGGTWYVMLNEEEMVKSLDTNPATDFVTCEVPYGGMLLFNNVIPHRSLMNLSNDIRWSFDFRWQKPDLPNGFYGLKESVLMRTASDPNFQISWEKFDSTVRHKLLRSAAVEEEEDEFDTTVPGPWMKKWEIAHVNHHVDSYRASTARTDEVQ